MHGQACTAIQASAGGHARHAATPDRAAPIDGTARQPGSAVPIPPLADPQGNDVTGRWPLRSFLTLETPPYVVHCDLRDSSRVPAVCPAVPASSWPVYPLPPAQVRTEHVVEEVLLPWACTGPVDCLGDRKVSHGIGCGLLGEVPETLARLGVDHRRGAMPQRWPARH